MFFFFFFLLKLFRVSRVASTYLVKVCHSSILSLHPTSSHNLMGL